MPGGLVPQITNSGPSKSLYAPAGASGGGGGGGPNPSVSSLTVAVGGAIEFLNDNSWDSQGLAWDTDATGTSTITFAPSYANDESGGGAGICLGVVLTTDAGGSYQNIGANTLFLNTGYGATPGAVLMNDPTNPGTAYVSSMRVSSINGVVPGGAAIPTAGISTNAVAAATGTKLTLNGALGVVIDSLGSMAVNGNQINAPGADLLISSINGAAPGGAISTFDSIRLNSISSIGSEVVIGQNLAVSNSIACSVLSTVGVTSLNSGNPVYISSLAVSSINGAAPGGGSIANLSTASLSSGFVLTPLGAPVVNMTGTFNTTAGHLYNLSWTDAVNLVGGVAPDSYIQWVLTFPSGAQTVATASAEVISSIVTSSITSHNINFTAPGVTAQLGLTQNGTVSTIVTLATGQDIILRDLGAVV